MGKKVNVSIRPTKTLIQTEKLFTYGADTKRTKTLFD